MRLQSDACDDIRNVLLDEMAEWQSVRVPEALGTHLSDEHLAKAARRAALRHRSYVANRHH